MLRPTPAETLAGLQRTLQTLAAELTSPYAQSQAATAAMTLGLLASTLDKHRVFESEETSDMTAALAALRRHAGSLDDELSAALELSARSAAEPRIMEETLARFAAALALRKLADPAAAVMRGYIARRLERARSLLGASTPGG